MAIFLRSFTLSVRRPALSLSRYGMGTRSFSSEEQKAAEAKEEPKKEEEGAAAADTPENQIITLNNKIDELKEHLLRQMAETENVRKQGLQLVEDAKKFGVQALLKDLIGVIDTLDIALEHTAPGKELNENDLRNFHSAIHLLEKDLHKSLAAHGVERFHPAGEDFNPNLHNALYVGPADLPKNKVAQVHKAGYLLHSRVIRPAHVGVSQGEDSKKD